MELGTAGRRLVLSPRLSLQRRKPIPVGSVSRLRHPNPFVLPASVMSIPVGCWVHLLDPVCYSLSSVSQGEHAFPCVSLARTTGPALFIFTREGWKTKKPQEDSAW